VALKPGPQPPTKRVMGNSPLVSVVIPCFNYGDYVADAVRSALGQDWPAVEVIVVDDGSTDHSPEVLAGFGAAVEVIRRENGGLNAATDTGVAAARGEFVTFLDADDTWQPGRVRALVEPLIAHPEVGLTYGDMTVVDADGRVLYESFNAASGFVPAPSGRFLGRMLRGNCVSAGAMMVRMSLRDHFHPIPPFAAWQDWWIATQVLREADILPVPDSVNIYRQHDSNMNLGADAKRSAKLLRTEVPFRRWLLSHTAPPLVTTNDLLSALVTLDVALQRIAAIDGGLPADLLAPEDAEARRALQEGREALCRADTDTGITRLVAAIAHAPAWEEPRRSLQETLDVLQEGPDARPAARERVELMPVEDVLAAPDRLADWVASHTDRQTTLVITGVADDSARDAVVAVVDGLGLSDDPNADLLAVAERDRATVAVRLGRALDEPLAA
jgi:hypothetical protein